MVAALAFPGGYQHDAAINTISLDCNALATLQESAALTLRFLRRCVPNR
jgi:hypothetical protein